MIVPNECLIGICPSQMDKSKCDRVAYWRLRPVRCEAAIRPKAGPKQKCLSRARIDVNDPKRPFAAIAANDRKGVPRSSADRSFLGALASSTWPDQLNCGEKERGGQAK